MEKLFFARAGPSLSTVLGFPGELFFPYFCPPVHAKNFYARAGTLPTVHCLPIAIGMIKMGPTGFDRMCEGVCQHAGSWGESLER